MKRLVTWLRQLFCQHRGALDHDGFYPAEGVVARWRCIHCGKRQWARLKRRGM